MVLGHTDIAPGQGYAAGRELLKQLYLQHFGSPVPEIAVTDRGKPYFIDSPVHFSVSHTGERKVPHPTRVTTSR